MKIEELIERLLKIKDKQEDDMDCSDDHMEADHLLLEYIDNEEVSEAFESIEKWYS